MMTVNELIEELKKHSPDKKVVVRGYESGYNDVLKIVEMDVFPNPGQNEWYFGEYEYANKEEDKKLSTPAVELYGDNTKSED